MSLRENIDPVLWGPSWWKVLESLYHHYPKGNIDEWTEEEKNYLSSLALFLYAMKDLLPCEQCRLHYREYIETHSIEDALRTSTLFWNWLFQLRHEIKPNSTITSEMSLRQSTDFFFPPPPAETAVPEPSPTVSSPSPVPAVFVPVSSTTVVSPINQIARSSSSYRPSFRSFPTRRSGCNCGR